MAQRPGVVIIARHGPRLDAADQQWHLSTPTPYDPPLTYGGWNQCRTLGVRIASLLHAREQEGAPVESPLVDGVTVHDFAQRGTNTGPRKRKRKHKVVIHSSPFLRCLQTSVAIASGMAQYSSPSDSRPVTPRSRTASSMHSASPRLRAMDNPATASLPAIVEPRQDLAHVLARRALHEHKRYRKSKLRVDAFLGEWLNPPYFEQITPPPPSAMMVAAAKAELMHNETVDIFTPSVTSKSSSGSLWGGYQKQESESSALDEWSDVHEALPTPSLRSRSNSMASAGSNESGSSRRSPKHGHNAHLTSTIPKPETTLYIPPSPHYAVSASDVIPRGYVSHARNACVNVDYQWDSSRPPQNWPDGGEYGEEWSAMHKRFRRGLNHLIHWYSQHDADDRAEDSLSFDQAERHEDEEEEELVLILVTHGAGSNALIGALTGQPVLLDVGMASLTMAVRRDDAPDITTYASSTAPSTENSPRLSPQLTNGHARRGSLDLGLNSVYEMKLVSSSEHLRPGTDPARLSAPTKGPIPSRSNNIPASFGSVRRPSVPPSLGRTNTAPAAVPKAEKFDNVQPVAFTGGLWTPPSGRTPLLEAQDKLIEERANLFSQSNGSGGHVSPGSDLSLDLSTSPPDSRPTSSKGEPKTLPSQSAMAAALNGNLDGAVDDEETEHHRGSISDLSSVSDEPPKALSRGLSQKGLWGTNPAGDTIARRFIQGPKRRWTMQQQQQPEEGQVS